jgi:hypothetical protein
VIDKPVRKMTSSEFAAILPLKLRTEYEALSPPEREELQTAYADSWDDEKNDKDKDSKEEKGEDEWEGEDEPEMGKEVKRGKPGQEEDDYGLPPAMVRLALEREDELPLPPVEVERFVPGFIAEGEDDAEEIGPDDEFKYDDIPSIGHGYLEQHREMREYARIIAWEMPLLRSKSRPEFCLFFFFFLLPLRWLFPPLSLLLPHSFSLLSFLLFPLSLLLSSLFSLPLPPFSLSLYLRVRVYTPAPHHFSSFFLIFAT